MILNHLSDNVNNSNMYNRIKEKENNNKIKIIITSINYNYYDIFSRLNSINVATITIDLNNTNTMSNYQINNDNAKPSFTEWVLFYLNLNKDCK